MSKQSYKAEQIVNLLRKIEVEIANSKTTPQAESEVGITEQTYYRWRKEYGGAETGPSEAAEGVGERERPTEAVGSRAITEEANVAGCIAGKLLLLCKPS